MPQAVGVGDQRRKRVPIWCCWLRWRWYAAGAAKAHAVRRAVRYHASLGGPVEFYYPVVRHLVAEMGPCTPSCFAGRMSLRWSGSAAFGVYLVANALTARKAYSRERAARYCALGDSAGNCDAGLFPDAAHGDEAVFVGGYVDKKRLRYLRHAGPEHVSAIAPSRSGKGVALIIPTLLTWKRSAVIYDMKGELWHYTSGWRKASGARTLRFEPTDTKGFATRFNPLTEIRIGEPREVSDTQNLATIICDPDGKGLESGGTEGHFRRIAQAFLVGVILHVLYKERAKGRTATLSDLARTISNPSGTVEDLLMEMLHFAHTPAGPHDVVGQAAMEMMNRESREKSGAISTAISFLSLYRDPVVASNVRPATSASVT